MIDAPTLNRLTDILEDLGNLDLATRIVLADEATQLLRSVNSSWREISTILKTGIDTYLTNSRLVEDCVSSNWREMTPLADGRRRFRWRSQISVNAPIGEVWSCNSSSFACWRAIVGGRQIMRTTASGKCAPCFASRFEAMDEITKTCGWWNQGYRADFIAEGEPRCAYGHGDTPSPEGEGLQTLWAVIEELSEVDPA
jgi:hypothetical protein